MSDEGKGRGGSYPNYPGRQKYELPIPYAPLGPPSDTYRDGWDRIFGPKPAPMADPPADPVQESPDTHDADVQGPCPLCFNPTCTVHFTKRAAAVHYHPDSEEPCTCAR